MADHTDWPLISVVVPALNEERNLPYVFERLPEPLHEVVLVDGGSRDRTVEVARRLRPGILVVQQTRKGKGNALACGFAHCTGDIVVMIDADGSTDPAEIPRFIAALVDGADLAKGTRFRDGGGSHDITRLRRLGNAGLNLVVNVLFRTRYSDLCYGYNAFWARALPGFDLPDPRLPAPADGSKLWGDGFEIETMLNVRAAVAGLNIAEVGSVEGARLHGVSNLNAPRDGLRVLRTILVEFRRKRRARTTDRRAVLANTQELPTVPRPRPAPTGVVARHSVPGAAVPGQRRHRPAHDDEALVG
ncbi:glycosyltransferase family 2 protein [Dactylosporangium sp. NPDC049140]|jgi:glycosyltransferase involved in cell wall biosynthesis|uniref:glycosyltransferase family 2 protein n=1 Tax=Dactylosporangium sp. NPDC049140 TaxID=3155647 RepID=UPI0033E7C63A